MFESHGFTEKDIRNVGAKTDEDIIFMAAIFTAIVEHPANTPRVMKKVKVEEDAIMQIKLWIAFFKQLEYKLS